MRTRSESSQLDNVGMNFSPHQVGTSAGGRLIRGFQKFWKNPKGQVVVPQPSTTDGSQVQIQEEPQIAENCPPLVVLSFEQHLEKRHFDEADQLLLERENRLFGRETESSQHREDEVAKLAADRAALEKMVLETVEQSLTLNPSDLHLQDALGSALRSIQQEEEQDQLWKHRWWTPPTWRPCGWLKLHRSRLQELVEERMDNTSSTLPPENQSSIQADIQNMGKRLNEDLLLVARVLMGCYPPEMDICNIYASLYHQTFRSRLRNIAEFCLDDTDCKFLLRWVNEFYPGILQNPELSAEINTAELGKLLPEDLLDSLEDQYLKQQQTELSIYISRVMEEGKEKYLNGEEPAKEDECYVSPVAYDMIQIINGMVTSAEIILGDLHKAQSVTSQLEDSMHRFKVFHEEVIKQNRWNSRAQIKAHLGCIAQFRDVLIRKKHLFPEGVKKNCLSVLDDMKQSAHTYLLTPVHKVLKPHYQKLGTSDWLNKNHFEKLLNVAGKELQALQGSCPSCNKELMGQLHQEVTEEYVRRLLRAEVKLKDRDKQHKAYTTVTDNAQSLHKLFCQVGSQEDWLKEILIKLAEVLKLQDVPAIQMQIVSLGADYPDLRERHVSALLKLKTNLSKADRRTVKITLADALKESPDIVTRPFFAKIEI